MTETMIHASRPWSGAPPTGSKERGPKFDKSILNDWSLRCVDCPFPERPSFCKAYAKKAPKECPLNDISV